MRGDRRDDDLEVLVVGGGQAGLAMGYHLTQQRRRFAILDAGGAPAAAWRSRWDSLRLFTPARHDALPGLPFPGNAERYPTRDEVVEYLTEYARRFALPVQLNTPVTSLRRDGDGYRVGAGDRTYRARAVVVATGPFQTPRTPAFASALDPRVEQLHSASYRRPDALPAGVRPRAVGASGGAVRFADGTAVEPATVIWATGFGRDDGWIDVPVLDGDGRPVHRRGVTSAPGLSFLGLPWQHTRGSALLGWVADDAAYLADRIAADLGARRRTSSR